MLWKIYNFEIKSKKINDKKAPVCGGGEGNSYPQRLRIDGEEPFVLFIYTHYRTMGSCLSIGVLLLLAD